MDGISNCLFVQNQEADPQFVGQPPFVQQLALQSVLGCAGSFNHDFKYSMNFFVAGARFLKDVAAMPIVR